MQKRLAEKIISAGAIALVSILNASEASSQSVPTNYPTAPVKFIVPFGPAGFPDVAARVVANKLGNDFNQSFVVENRPGAGGIIGGNAVFKSPPDGYTLFVATTSFWALTPLVFKNIPFDINGFVPVARLLTLYAYFCVSNGVPGKDFNEVIAFLKQHPEKANYGSPGTGSVPHLLLAVLTSNYGLKATHVPYKSGPEVLQGQLSGQIQLAFHQANDARGLIENKAGRCLAIASPKRSKMMPDVPTFGELGFPDLDLPTVLGILAPPGTPAAIVDKLQGALTKAAGEPDFAEKVQVLGAEATPGTAKELVDEMQQDVRVYKKAAPLADIHPQ
jgi:tripartite-type tricarboxylate transporter receptor subunit TctC